MPLGVNLENVSDWSRLQPFVDLMKGSRRWGSVGAPWDEATPVDALGWPTTDAGIVINTRTADTGEETKPSRYLKQGTYALRFAGRAVVAPVASTGVTIRNASYDAASDRSQAEVVVGSGATQILLSFTNTSNGVRDVTLRQPGYDSARTFTDEFSRAIAPFQVLRFMDFLRTNANPVRTWSERVTPSSASQGTAKGGAHEYAIQMANEFQKDIWVNIPVNADDNYVRALAQLLNQTLAPERAVYVEFSNELWNGAFSQTAVNRNAAVAEAIAGDTTLTRGTLCTQAQFDASSGACNPYWAALFRVGKRTARISQIFTEVFGAGALNTRFRPVYATQWANSGIAEQVLKNMATYRGAPSSLIYAVATAPYYNLPSAMVTSTTATTTDILAALATSLHTNFEPKFGVGSLLNGTFVRGNPYNGGDYTSATHKALADYYRIKSVAYEMGPDFGQSTASIPAKMAANRDPAMGDLVRSGMTQWFGCGNDLYMHFNLTSGWDRYGYWGLTNDGADLATPKYTVASAVAQSARSAYTTCR